MLMKSELRSTSSRSHLLPLAAISAIVLGLEVFETRLLSYSVPMFFIYAVVGIALLGFGAAGTLVSTRLDWLAPERLRSHSFVLASPSECVSRTPRSRSCANAESFAPRIRSDYSTPELSMA
jgi:hypothetical protein